MKSSRLFFAVVAIAAALAVRSATAKEESPLEFLHLMQKDGFPDIAVDYLEKIKDDPAAPPEIKRLWDLEMSRSKREWAKSGAYSAAHAKQLMDESKALMDKFIKENPNMPEAIQAAADWAAQSAIEAQYDVLRANNLTDKKEKAEMLAKARKIFEDVRPRFVASKEAAAKQFAALTQRDPKRKADDLFRLVAESRLKLAMVDFYLALTQEAGSQRNSEFSQNAKEFDKIFQDYRAYEGFIVDWEAHYWNGRISQEEGKFQEAKDIYEEVLAYETKDVVDSSTAGGPDKATLRAREPGPEEFFFAEVQQHYLQALYATVKTDYFKETPEYLKSHKAGSEKCAGYQGLALDYVRHVLALREEAKDENLKKKAMREALRVLSDSAKVDSPYKRDQIELLRKLAPNATQEDSFEFALIDGDAALEKKDWPAAIDMYDRALQHVTTKIPKDKVAAVRNIYVGCVHNQAAQLYQKGKVDEAINLIVDVLKRAEFLDAPTAPAAAAAALSWRFFQYLAAPQDTPETKTARDALRKKTIDLANAIIGIRSWTAKEEADSARVVLLRICLEQKDVAETARHKALEEKLPAEAEKQRGEADKQLAQADRIFKEINPNSREYATALTALGFEHWHDYRVAKKALDESGKAPAKEQKDKLDGDRSQAVEYTRQAVEALARVPRPTGSAMPKELRQSSVQLADMYAEGSDYKNAVVIYQGLIDDILADSSAKSLDELTLRVFNGAVQAYLQLNDMKNAGVVATKLLELGPDARPVNMAIINFAKRLEMARKQAMLESETAESAAKQQAIIDLEDKIMVALAGRTDFSATTKVWIVRTLSLLNRDDADEAATQLAGKLNELALKEDAIQNEIGKALAGLHSLAANIQAKHGHYEEADEQIQAVITQFPSALEPQMTRGQILAKWAAKDSSKYGEAIVFWHKLAGKLERVKTKSGDKMNEYYEAVYNEYSLFYAMAQKTNDKELAKKGFDLITPLLEFDPKIQGPNRDRELSVKFYRLAGKLADFIGVDHPTMPGASKPKR